MVGGHVARRVGLGAWRRVRWAVLGAGKCCGCVLEDIWPNGRDLRAVGA